MKYISSTFFSSYIFQRKLQLWLKKKQYFYNQNLKAHVCTLEVKSNFSKLLFLSWPTHSYVYYVQYIHLGEL